MLLMIIHSRSAGFGLSCSDSIDIIPEGSIEHAPLWVNNYPVAYSTFMLMAIELRYGDELLTEFTW
jgi:hypothetical protein